MIELTDHARALEPVLVAAAREVNELALGELDNDDQRRLFELLALVTSNLEAAADSVS